MGGPDTFSTSIGMVVVWVDLPLKSQIVLVDLYMYVGSRRAQVDFSKRGIMLEIVLVHPSIDRSVTMLEHS